MRLLKSVLLVIFVISFNACNLQNEKSDSDNRLETNLNPEAPKETELLGQLAGAWNAEQSILNNDGVE